VSSPERDERLHVTYDNLIGFKHPSEDCPYKDVTGFQRLFSVMTTAAVFTKLVYHKECLEAVEWICLGVEDYLEEIVTRGFASIFETTRVLVVRAVKYF
jgi:hypothetical protein